MAAQTSIPLTFDTSDPEALKRELERTAAALAAYFATLTGQPHATVVQRRLTKRPLNDASAAFWQITPVALANASDIHRISLPRPDPRMAGMPCVILRKGTLGTIKVSAPGCLINGFTLVEQVNDAGLVAYTFDGENYYTEPGATWGT